MRQHFKSDEAFVHSAIDAIWKEVDIGSWILSQRPLDERGGSRVGIYRRYQREKFSSRESRIVHIVLSEIPWLHEQGWPEDRGSSVSSLSKRQRLTLNLLTRGKSRKEIASQMNISVHTVQEYIKNIYRHFGVNSQVELMNRFFQGKE